MHKFIDSSVIVFALRLTNTITGDDLNTIIDRVDGEGDRRMMLSVILFILSSIVVSAAYQVWLKQRASKAALGTIAA